MKVEVESSDLRLLETLMLLILFSLTTLDEHFKTELLKLAAFGILCLTLLAYYLIQRKREEVFKSEFALNDKKTQG